MKKYYIQVILASAFVGVLVKWINQLMTGTFMVTDISHYIMSVIIGISCGFVTMSIYTLLLINSKLKRWIKYLVSYISIITVYFLLNIPFSGIKYLIDLDAYILGSAILIMSTPLLIVIERNSNLYNNSLESKKAKNKSINKDY